ncbi:MAG TPA: hypothetical protein VGL82_16500 [Bryobacteraceae bacterium]|jgi:hypothetical protein
MRDDYHLSDHELLLASDGELSSSAAARVESHLAACWTCRARRQQLDEAVVSFVRTYQRAPDVQVAPVDGPRALLKARMSRLAETRSSRWQDRLRHPSWRWSFSALAIAALGMFSWLVWPAISPPQVKAATFTIPKADLTPGAAVLVGRDEVCRASGTKNKQVSRAIQREVFREYGIPGAEPRAYEVDYLITPALGGADDIHNLWPESNAATVWNAQVKDALEDHLRDMVCSGRLDLATAQREIAVNWIEAYKKYFHTNRPLGGEYRK